ncbi:MAG: hypothetical protein ABI624_24135 [Casimicrobiaceae bacterium]
MQRHSKRRRSTRRASPKRGSFELPPDRAFVLQLDARALLPGRVAGRVEHITSGRIAHVTSQRELLVFLADVLRSQQRGEPEAADEPLADNRQNDLAASARGSLDGDAARAAAQPIPRDRKRGGKS